MNKFKIELLSALTLFSVAGFAQEKMLVETENFDNKGGWVVDQQFMDLMGSPYLMAHGLGIKVDNASTTLVCKEAATYNLYARTYNWTSVWYDGKGPGEFKVKVNGKSIASAGNVGDKWIWQKLGAVKLKKGDNIVELEDLTGFNGRCDALYFTVGDDTPPENLEELADFRAKYSLSPQNINDAGDFDLVVVGGGIAGISASVSAARLGLKVALINDRPVLGGNNSAEIRVHLGGKIELEPYPKLGELQKEFGHTRKGNAQPADYYEDYKKQAIVDGEPNITLFASTRAVGVTTENNEIKSVLTENIESGVKHSFSAPLFVDCTGDGTIGYLSGADYLMGRESKEEYNEELAPEVADKLTMGASVQWYSKESDKKTKFPIFKYGVDFNATNFEDVTMGEWTWETGMNFDQINDFERIRDYGMMVIFSNWSYLKNEKPDNEKFQNLELEWVAYVSGKRESRRLLGDYILKQQDVTHYIEHEDGTASTSWSIDLHYPDPENTKNFPGSEFKSIAKHVKIYPYPIPYRCFYSRNVNNLFMAGRDISVTHAALGTVRVMRTTGMMGEVVGMAAYLCNKYDVLPRGIYYDYLPQLRELMKKGVGKREGMINNQTFNISGSLKEKPTVK